MKNLQKVYNKKYYYANKQFSGKYINYDLFESKIEKHYWHFAIKEALKYKNKGTILDIGCAVGHMLNCFPDSFKKFGCDISNFAITRAIKKYPNIKFKQNDISKTKPFKQKFDLIIALDVLEHVLDLESTLKNISLMLKDDGVLIIGVPVTSRAHYLLSVFEISLINAESHISQTKTKTWKNIILPVYFDIIYDKPITALGYYVLPFELAHLFIVQKNKN